MPRRTQKPSDGRRIGSREQRTATKMTERQRLWLGVLVAFCQLRGAGVFVGTPTTTGSVRINIYPEDDKCVGSLHLMDNFADEVPILLSDAFEETITIEGLERAVPWLAVAASKASVDEKPALRPQKAVEVP